MAAVVEEEAGETVRVEGVREAGAVEEAEAVVVPGSSRAPNRERRSDTLSFANAINRNLNGSHFGGGVCLVGTTKQLN